jgi:hypothetical protein
MIDTIRSAAAQDSIVWKDHSIFRMRQRHISVEEVLGVLRAGNIIESYPDDHPFSSALMCGFTAAGRPMHLVVGVNVADVEIHIVTAYEPDPAQWRDNFSRRVDQ